MAIIQVLNLCQSCANKLSDGYHVAKATCTIEPINGKCNECEGRGLISTYTISKKIKEETNHG